MKKNKAFRIPFITKKQLKSRQALHRIFLKPHTKYTEVSQSSTVMHPFLIFYLFQKCLTPQVRTDKWYQTVLFTTTLVLQE